MEGGDRGQYEYFPYIRFVHFCGVTPRRYREMFERGKRKNGEGTFVEFGKGERCFFLDYSEAQYLALEEKLAKKAEEMMGVSG